MDDRTYQLETIRRRKAEIEAHLGVIAAQQQLAKFYNVELQEITEFLSAVEASETEGNWGGVADDAPGPHNKENK